MEVFEGKAWISGQGLIDTCIGVEDGKITAVKKVLKGDKHIAVAVSYTHLTLPTKRIV